MAENSEVTLEWLKSKWYTWAILESFAKTVGGWLRKGLSLYTGSFSGVLMITVATSSIQTMGGLIGSLIGRKPLFPRLSIILGSIFFGVIATLMSVSTTSAFIYGADFGIAMFIATAGLIPGIFIDWWFPDKNTGERIRPQARHVGGVLLYIFFAWAMFGFKFYFKIWVLFMLIEAMLGALNEGITRALAIKKADALPHNFWAGLTRLVLCGLAVTILGYWGIAREMQFIFWVLSAAIGVQSIFLLTFKLITYKKEGTVVLKKMVMQGSRMFMGTLIGIIWFNEPATLGKLIGIIGFFLSFAITDNKVYNHFVKVDQLNKELIS